LDEGAVDLDLVHREALEVGHRREPCPEVVERDLDAHLGEPAQHLLGAAAGVDQDALGDLHLQQLRGMPSRAVHSFTTLTSLSVLTWRAATLIATRLSDSPSACHALSCAQASWNIHSPMCST